MEAIIIIFLVVTYLTVGVGMVAKRSWPVYKILTWPFSVIMELVKNNKGE